MYVFETLNLFSTFLCLGNGDYDLKILRSLFRAKQHTSEPQLAHWLPDAHNEFQLVQTLGHAESKSGDR